MPDTYPFVTVQCFPVPPPPGPGWAPPGQYDVATTRIGPCRCHNVLVRTCRLRDHRGRWGRWERPDGRGRGRWPDRDTDGRLTTFRRSAQRSVQVVAEDLGAGGVAELGHGLGLDLADALPGDPVDLADLVQGLGLAVGQAEPHRDHARLALGQRVEHRVQLFLQQGEADRLAGLDRLGVLDQVTELAVAVLAERSVQRDRLAAVLLHLDDLLRGHVQLDGQLLRGRLAAEILEHLPLYSGQLVDDLDHVHRDADGAGLVSHGPGNGLPDPPGRVRGE